MVKWKKMNKKMAGGIRYGLPEIKYYLQGPDGEKGRRNDHTDHQHGFGTEIPMSVRASEVSVEREKPKWDDTITNRMLHWSYTPEQKEEVKKALAAGVPKATILTYFYPEVTVEKMRSYRKKQ